MEGRGFQDMGDSSGHWVDTAVADQVKAERARQLVVNFQKSTFCQLLICQLSKVNFLSTFKSQLFVNFQKSTFVNF